MVLFILLRRIAATKCRTSSGMSSGRSRKGGMEIGKNIQPVVEVAAKLFFPDHLFQIAMSRGHNPNVNFLRSRTAQPLEFSLLQDAKKFRLQLQRDIANFIQKQRTLVCQLKPANLLSDRTGEGAALVAKQFAFEQTAGNGGAIDFTSVRFIHRRASESTQSQIHWGSRDAVPQFQKVPRHTNHKVAISI